VSHPSSSNEAVDRIERSVIENTDQCEHIMALHFDPRGDYQRGILRCIVSREGQVTTPGFVDTSRVHVVEMRTPSRGHVGPELDIDDAHDVVAGLPEYEHNEFLGFEDPNLWCDREAGRLHFYCTIPFFDCHSGELSMYLGHAEGPDIESLRMTDPVLEPDPGAHRGAKEVAIAPQSEDGVRFNLVESNDIVDGTMYSVLRTAVAPDLGGPWEYGDIALHPMDYEHEWIAGHVSPGPLLPREFCDVGPDRLVGLLNGRDRGGPNDFGRFTVGLMVYNYEEADIEWVSSEPLIDDPDAAVITFASAFRVTGPGEGIVYAHVDDSTVRAYHVDAERVALDFP